MSCAHPTYRAEAIQYISPTFAGFTFSASVGEAAKTDVSPDNVALNRQEALGINYGVDLKYAGEFSGVRIAASLGYEKSRLNDDDGVVYNSDFIHVRRFAGSLLHVPTGLFAQGYYGSAKGAPFDSNSLTRPSLACLLRRHLVSSVNFDHGDCLAHPGWYQPELVRLRRDGCCTVSMPSSTSGRS